MSNTKKIFLSLFVCAEFAFLMLILFVQSHTNYFEFFSIVLAFLFAAFYFQKNAQVFACICALFFTMTADYFLEIQDPMMQTVAMTSFFCVQIFHFLRMYLGLKTTKFKIINLSTRIVVCIVAIIVCFVVLKEKTDYLSIVSVLYIANLFLNIILAFCEFKQSPLLALGLLLFLGCDITIGLQMANGVYFDIAPNSFIYKFITMPFNFAWACYLPSQTLISLSILNIKTKK